MVILLCTITLHPVWAWISFRVFALGPRTAPIIASGTSKEMIVIEIIAYSYYYEDMVQDDTSYSMSPFSLFFSAITERANPPASAPSPGTRIGHLTRHINNIKKISYYQKSDRFERLDR